MIKKGSVIYTLVDIRKPNKNLHCTVLKYIQFGKSGFTTWNKTTNLTHNGFLNCFRH